MSWLGWSTPPDAASLGTPSGKPPPLICKTCRGPQELCGHAVPAICDICSKQICECNKPSIKNSKKKVVPPQIASIATPAVPVVVAAAPPPAPPKVLDCAACMMNWSKCTCIAVLGERESALAGKMTVSQRIVNMKEFLQSLNSVDGFSPACKEISTELDQYGALLLEQETVVEKNMNKGVVKPELLKQHNAAVDEWLELCYDHLASALRRSGLTALRERIKQTHSVCTPPAVVEVATASTTSNGVVEKSVVVVSSSKEGDDFEWCKHGKGCDECNRSELDSYK